MIRTTIVKQSRLWDDFYLREIRYIYMYGMYIHICICRAAFFKCYSSIPTVMALYSVDEPTAILSAVIILTLNVSVDVCVCVRTRGQETIYIPEPIIINSTVLKISFHLVVILLFRPARNNTSGSIKMKRKRTQKVVTMNRKRFSMMPK